VDGIDTLFSSRKAKRMTTYNPYLSEAVDTPSFFYGRSETIRFILNQLQEPQAHPIILFGQRKAGKTAVFRHLLHLKPEGFVWVYFDLQGYVHAPLAETLFHLAEAIAHQLDIAIPTKKTFLKDDHFFETKFLNQIRSALKDRHPDQPPAMVLLLDEFHLPRGADVARDDTIVTFFPFLYQLLQKDAPLRLVLTFGPELAISYRNNPQAYQLLTQILSSPLLHEGVSHHVTSLSVEDALKLIKEPVGNQLVYNPEALDRILSLASTCPFLIRQLCGLIYEKKQPADSEPVAIYSTDVEAVKTEFIRRLHSHFDALWDDLPLVQKVIFWLIAKHRDSQGAVPRQKLVSLLERQHIKLPKGLFQNHELVAEENHVVRFRIGGFGDWLVDQDVENDLMIDFGHAENSNKDGSSAHFAGEFERALEYYREAVAINPYHLDAQLGIAEVLSQLGRTEESIEEYEKAYQLDPFFVADDLVNARLKYAGELEQAGDKNGAILQYSRILEISPNHMRAQELWAELVLEKGQNLCEQENWDDAIYWYQQLLNVAPALTVARCALAEVYLRKGEYEAAVNEYEKAHNIDRSESVAHGLAKARLKWGEELKEEGMTPEAIANYKRVLLTEPDEETRETTIANLVKLMLRRADQSAQAGDLLKAREEYRRVIEMDGNCLEAMIKEAGVVYAMGDYDEAIRLFEAACEINEDIAKPAMIATQLNYADRLATNGAWDTAMEVCDTVLALDPENVLAQDKRRQFEDRRNQTPPVADAGTTGEPVSTADPDPVTADSEQDTVDLDREYQQAMAYLENKQWDEALESLNHIFEQDPDYRDADQTPIPVWISRAFLARVGLAEDLLPQRIQQLEAELAALKDAHAVELETLRTAETEASWQLESLETERDQLQIELKTVQRQLADAEAKVKQMEAENLIRNAEVAAHSQDLSVHVTSADQTIDEMNDLIAQLNLEKQALKHEVAQLRDQLLEQADLFDHSEDTPQETLLAETEQLQHENDQLRKTNEMLAAQLQRLQEEIEASAPPAETGAPAADRIAELEAQLATLKTERNELQTVLDQVQSDAAELKQEFTSLREQHQHDAETVKALEQANRQLQEEIVALEQDAIDPQELKQAEETIAQLTRERDQLQLDLQVANEKLKTLQNSIQNTPDRSAEIRALENEIDILTERLEHATGKENKLIQKNVKMMDINTRLLKQISELQTEVENAQSRLNETTQRYEKTEIPAYRLKLENLKRELEQQTADYDQLHAEVEHLRAENQQLHDQIAQLEDRTSELDLNLKSYETDQLRPLEQEANTLRQQLHERDQQINELQKTITRLETQLDNLKADLAEQQRRYEEVEIPKREDAIRALEAQQQEQTAAQTALEEQLQRTQAELDDARQQWRDIEHDYKTLQTTNQDLQHRVEDLQHQLETIQHERDQLQQEITGLQQKLEAEQFRHQEERKSLKSEIETLATEAEQYALQTDELRQLLTQQQATAEKLRAEYDHLEEQYEQVRLPELNEKIQTLQENVTHLEARQVELENLLDKAERDLAYRQERLNQLQQRYDTETASLRRQIENLSQALEAKSDNEQNLLENNTALTRANTDLLRQLSQLKDELNEAQRQQAQFEQIERLQLQNEIDKLKRTLATEEHQREHLESELETATQALEDAHQRAITLQQDYEENVIAPLQQEVDDLRRTVNEAKTHEEILQRRLREMEQENHQLVRDLEALREEYQTERLPQLERQLKDQQEETAAKANRIRELETQLHIKDQEMAALRTELQQMQTHYEQERLAPLEQRLAQLETQLFEAEGNLSDARAHATSLQDQIDDLQQQLEEQQIRYEVQQIKPLQHQIDLLQQKVTAAERTENQLKAKAEDAESAHQYALQQIEVLQDEIDLLREKADHVRQQYEHERIPALQRKIERLTQSNHEKSENIERLNRLLAEKLEEEEELLRHNTEMSDSNTRLLKKINELQREIVSLRQPLPNADTEES